MDKKQLLKDFIIYLMLFMIIPAALYINFFILDYLTIWSYEIKAWIIYSIIIVLGELLVLFLSYFIIKHTNIKIFKEIKNDRLIGKSFKIFLLGNILFIASPFKEILWFIVPLFQVFILFSFVLPSIIDNIHTELPISKQLFSIKKIEDPLIKRKIMFVLVITIIYFVLNTTILFIINRNYNPARKSLEYFFEGTGIKVNFKK